MKRPYKLTNPAPWHADGRKRADHGARKHVAEWRAYQAAWAKPIDELKCDAESFYHLRRNVLGLNREQCARLLRVHRGSLLFWEKGTYRVPFFAYLALLLISESMLYRMSSEQWKDWELVEHFDYVPAKKQAPVTRLVNRQLGASFSTDELERYHFAMNRLAALDSENFTLRNQVDALTLENTEIRELFRANAVTDELHGMRERVDNLLGRINTAAVVPLKKSA